MRNELALFAGAGGGILGSKLLGWKTVCAVEIEEFPRNVLLQRQNDGSLDPFPIWDDIRTFDGRPWRGIVDVVSGGFPCQDISSAGNRAGITEDSRSGLWMEMARVIDEVRPQHVFVENSPILTVRGLGRVLGDLAEMGFDARWGVFGVSDSGGDIERKRLWIVAGPCEDDGRWVYRWPYQNRRNMGEHITTRSQIDRYLEELQRQGGQRPNQGKGDIPPYLCSMDDGLADELDEIRAIGNGQSPIVAAEAWTRLVRCIDV